MVCPDGPCQPAQARSRQAAQGVDRCTLQSPEFRKKIEATGSVVASPTVDTDKFIASEVDKYRKSCNSPRLKNEQTL